MVTLRGLDDPHTVCTVAFEAGPLLSDDDVNKARFDVLEEPFKGRPLLVSLAGDVIVLINTDGCPPSGRDERFGVLTVPVHAETCVFAVLGDAQVGGRAALIGIHMTNLRAHRLCGY
nr:hypothetical protein [Arthrobacter crusticola]